MRNRWFGMRRSSFIEGTFIATFAIIFIKILGMLYVIPFYAVVGIQGSALYAYAYGIYNMFLDISTIGLPIAMSKITNEYHTLKKMDAKKRAYDIAINIMRFASIAVFILLFLFAKPIAMLIIGNLTGGNTIENVTTAIRFVSLAILVIPYLSVTKGYLQGHNIINIPSAGNIIEQVVRIIVVLGGSFIAIKVLNKSADVGVNIALLGAFVGGIASYAYIKIKMKKNKKQLSLTDDNKPDRITNKTIRKKLISYAVPFIIINAVSSLYGFIDLLLVLRTMEGLGMDTITVEFIATSISTWAGKLNMIVTSIAMGMSVSLIPSIVESFTLKKWPDVNKKINSALKMILFISLPMAIGISMLAPSIWSVFYGHSDVGATILSVSIFTAVALNMYMVTSSIIQGLNKFKTVYIASISGFVINGLLDVPLMLLFNKIGLQPYLGALAATIIGFLISSNIALGGIKKEHKMDYKDTITTLLKMLVPLGAMIVAVLLLNIFIPVNLDDKLSCILFIISNALVGGSLYFVISWKMDIFKDVFGRDAVNKFIIKLKKLILRK